jgi:hypothetical protein
MIITPSQVSEWKKSVRLALNKDIEEIDVLDVVSMDIRRVREIQKLANEIEGKSHKEQRESKDRAWTKKICQEADLWDSDASVSVDDDYEDSYDTGRRTNRTDAQPDIADLDSLVRDPLPSFSK